MKTTIDAVKTEGQLVCKHEIEVVCAHCQDPVSEVESQTGVCTNCGQPWRPKQSISIWATSVPKAGAKTWGQ